MCATRKSIPISGLPRVPHTLLISTAARAVVAISVTTCIHSAKPTTFILCVKVFVDIATSTLRATVTSAHLFTRAASKGWLAGLSPYAASQLLFFSIYTLNYFILKEGSTECPHVRITYHTTDT